MPNQEQHEAQPIQGLPEAQELTTEQRFRTIAVRVEEDLHAQLQFLADLAGTNLSTEVRKAIEDRILNAQDDPDLIAKAQAARAEIEREAAARAAAITGFMGHSAVTGISKPTSRRTTNK